MLYSGADPESYIPDCTLVYEEYPNRHQVSQPSIISLWPAVRIPFRGKTFEGKPGLRVNLA
jgi:hypothetical protein